MCAVEQFARNDLLVELVKMLRLQAVVWLDLVIILESKVLGADVEIKGLFDSGNMCLDPITSCTVARVQLQKLCALIA